MRIYQEKNKQRNAILLQFSLLTDLVPSLGQPNGNYVKTVRMLNNHKNYYNEQILEYAKSGAVKRLQRRGRKNDGHSGKIDNLHITLKGNRLHYVSDDADKLQYDGAFDFNGDASNSSAFQYNANGSLITDTGKGIMFIEYDDNGMPRRIQFADGNVTEYVYAATGRKLRTVYYTAIPGITVGSGETHQLTASEILSKDSIDYLGSLILVNGLPDQYLFQGGYCSLNDVNASGGIGWHYYNRDHLGNNREVVSESGTLEQVTNYYPFGAPFCERTTAGANTNATLQRYKYNGKELDLMHGLKWYDYGARMYDPILLTWNGIDPMCEDYYPICPYAYCGNNPVNAFDPDGKSIYMLFYTSGNKRGDEMFRTATETRKYDIEHSDYYDPSNDIVIIGLIQDIASISQLVRNIVDTYSDIYGETAEFSIWSHAGIDGPTGTVLTSSNAVDRNQMSIEGWGDIDFNWGKGATAYFFGCKTGVNSNEKASFATRVSSNSNFRDVTVYGQTSSAYPSKYVNVRENSHEMMIGRYSYPTYMVGGKPLGIVGKLFPTFSQANPMQKNINGRVIASNCFQKGRKYR